jgi:hypothetical protein
VRADIIATATFTLELSEPEREELFRLVQHKLEGTCVETHRLHTPEYRERMLRLESILLDLLDKLQRLS